MKHFCIALLLAASLTGCTINRALINSADRFVNKTVGPEYEQYVADDAKLTPAAKALRKQNVESFRIAVQVAQK